MATPSKTFTTEDCEKAKRAGILCRYQSSKVCPNGHRPPRVQYLKDDDIYCCTTCAITWKAAYSINIPHGMTAETIQRAISRDAVFGETLAALKEACGNKCFCLILEEGGKEGEKCWACNGRAVIAKAESGQ